MITREELRGQWNEVKGRLQEHWGQLTDDDLRRAEGSTDRLVGVVQQKTGATKREVEEFLDQAMASGRSTLQQASESAAQYVDEATELARQQYARAAAATDQMSKQVVHTVRSRPMESLVIAFGVGIAAGALMFLGRRR
ncbi:MAG: CsbD family protein [Pirellulaceae bacterium]